MLNPSKMNPDEFISYLAKHGITDYKQRGDEVSFPCPFHGCDDDHRSNEEFHCSFNVSNCTYNCFKCGEKGNFVTLRKYFGDYDESQTKQKTQRRSTNNDTKTAFQRKVLEAFNNTHEKAEVREYLNGRGINGESLKKYMLGLWNYNGQDRIMIPVFNKDNEIAYLKLRSTPVADAIANEMGHENSDPKYVVYPAGASVILVGEDQLARSSSSDVLICEGEFDRIIAIQEGVKMPVVSGGGGAQTFKDEWIDSLADRRNIYICFDRDKTGEDGAKKLAHRIAERIPTSSVYTIMLPFKNDSKADLTDYFVSKRGTAEELFTKYATFCCGAEPIDPSKFEELTVDGIAKILDSTVKYDYTNKVITFLAMLLAYTDSDQLNIMFNASSSTGKSYICHEIKDYFPSQDVSIYGKTTPTAFYYSRSLRRIDDEKKPYIDLARRIMIFVEQPDTGLQENLRAILSHESKIVPFAITNKEKSGRNAADEGYIVGFPTALFCSANMMVDEQEQTRCIILSPESSRKKVMAGIDAYIEKSCRRDEYDAKLRSDDARKMLRERVLYIKSLNVGNIDIDDSEYLKQTFLEMLGKNLPAKAMREISQFGSLVKAMALINAPFRMINGRIVATRKDIDEAKKLWKQICISMVYGISPQVMDFYMNVVLPAWHKKHAVNLLSKGVTFNEIKTEYYAQTGSYPHMENMRKQWMPMLETASFVSCEQDELDRRRTLVVPQVFLDDNLEK